MTPNPNTAAPREVDDTTLVVDDVAYLRTLMVNLYFIGPAGAGDREWTLVDAGMSGYADQIVRAAGKRFGEGSRPGAIVLTHGHFDHVGSLEQLGADGTFRFTPTRWNFPT